MIRWLNKLKNAWAVLNGNATANYKKKRTTPFRNVPFTKTEIDFLQSIKIEFLFSEFGAQRVNGGGLDFQDKGSRLDPSDRKSTRLNSSHLKLSRMPSSA